MLIVSFAKKMSVLVSLFLILATCILCPHPAYAQSSGATLSGTVTDASGAAIPDAQITVTATATGNTRTLTTSGAGYYNVPNLQSGSYKISVSAPGFATQERTGVTLTVGAAVVIDVAMQVGSVTQSVQVTGDALAVQLASSSVSDQVNATTVRELPLNGRSWTDLASLQAGVNSITTQPSYASGSDRGNRGFGAQSSISGARPQQNNYRLDGISINDYSSGAPGSVLGGNLGVEAIQEFSVLTSSYGAEYGKTSGGVMNAITRSGTNLLRGSAYEFLRNSKLDARNTFDGPTVPEFRQNQFGIAAGGPIIKDRTFVFGDYEGVRHAKGITNNLTVPSLTARAGKLNYPTDTAFPSACVGNSVIGTSNGINYHQCQVDLTAPLSVPAARYLALYPLPTTTSVINIGNSATSIFAGNQVVNENYFTTRLDHKFSEKDSIFGTYVYDKTPYNSPDGFDNVQLTNLVFRQVVVLEETHIFNPNVINTLRVGFNRNRVDNDISTAAINPAAGDLTLGAIPGQYASNVAIQGLDTLPGGIGGNPRYFFRWNSLQASDDAFITKGTHSLKFGFNVERMQLNVFSFSNPTGVWSFESYYNFLANIPKKFNAALPESTHDRYFRQTYFGGYVADDWRVRPNLTLNLGLRWEMTTVPTETKNRLVNLANLTDTTLQLGNFPLYHNPTTKDFQPRIGFAWDPFKDGKTAVRGGFGIFDVLPVPAMFFLEENLVGPYFALGSVSGGHLPAGSFYNDHNNAKGAGILLGPSSLREAYIESHPHRNYVMQYNLNLQRAITPTISATIAYVGSHGIHMPIRSDDINIVMPTNTPSGLLWPCGPMTVSDGPPAVINPCAVGFISVPGQIDVAASPINTKFGSIRSTLWEGMSYYNSLQAQVTKSMSHGIQINGAFTWARSIDNSSATLAGDQFSNSLSTLDSWYNLPSGRALADFNIGRTGVLSVIWEAPGLKSSSGVANWLASGWQLGTIFKVADGTPFTPTFGSDGDVLGKLNGDSFDYPNRLGGSGCNSLINSRNTAGYIKTQCFAVPTAPNAAFFTAHCDPTFGTLANLQCAQLRGNSGRNIINGPGITNLDFSVFKNNRMPKLSENFNIQFRAEFFNVLNHANYNPPPTTTNTDIFAPDGTRNAVAGRLKSAAEAREIQFAIKVVF